MFTCKVKSFSLLVLHNSIHNIHKYQYRNTYNDVFFYKNAVPCMSKNKYEVGLYRHNKYRNNNNTINASIILAR